MSAVGNIPLTALFCYQKKAHMTERNVKKTMEHIYKYPRTRHIEGSRKQTGDEDLKSVSFQVIRGRYLVLEEKIDGANCGISFGRDGEMYLQSRGHFLNGGYGEKQFGLFKSWAGCCREPLWRTLGSRYIMYGEWMYAKHTVFYDRLPHYFMEFDIFDKEEERFFSTKKRKMVLEGAPFIQSVPVLEQGRYERAGDIEKLIGHSRFISADPLQSLREQCRNGRADLEQTLRQTDASGAMEGIYIKVEEGDYVTDRFKFVRHSFLNAILDSESHWVNRPIVANRLAEGIDLFDLEKGGHSYE